MSRGDIYRLTIKGSTKSISTIDSSPEVKDGDQFTFKKGSPYLMVENSASDLKDEHSTTISMSDSPFYSALNLPMIIEEDAESEHGRGLQKFNIDTLDSDDSPFFRVVNAKNGLSFEDS